MAECVLHSGEARIHFLFEAGQLLYFFDHYRIMHMIRHLAQAEYFYIVLLGQQTVRGEIHQVVAD